MSDTPTPGERLDTVLADLQTAWGELRTELDARAADLGQAIGEKVDALSAKIDEAQTAWDNRSV